MATLGEQTGATPWPDGGSLGEQSDSTPYGIAGYTLGEARDDAPWPPPAITGPDPYPPLYFDDGFAAGALRTTPSPPAGATWPTMPASIPAIVPPFSFEQGYAPPGYRDGWQDNFIEGGKALQVRVDSGESIAKLGGSAYSWGPNTVACESTIVNRWQVNGSWVGYRQGMIDAYGLRVVPLTNVEVFGLFQMGYSVVRYGNLAIRIYNNEMGFNQASGYSNGVPGSNNTKSHFHINITPGGGKLVIGRVYDFIIEVKWSTYGQGFVKIRARCPEISTAWTVVWEEYNIDTQQWGYEDPSGLFVPQEGTGRIVTDKMALYGPLGTTAKVQYHAVKIGQTFEQVEYFMGLAANQGGSGFPSVAQIDDYNRADGALGANYAGIATAAIATNRVAGSGASNSFYWNAGDFGPDVEAEIELAAIPTAPADRIVLQIRHPIGVLNFYQATIDVLADGTWTVSIHRVDGGVETTLSSVNGAAWVAGDRLGIKMIGSDISVYRRPVGSGSGTLVLSATDATYAVAGKVRIVWTGTVTRLDNLRAGTPAGGEFPPVTLVDDLNRADGALGLSWAGITGAAVMGNRMGSATSPANAYWNVDYGPDLQAEVKVAVQPPAPADAVYLQIRHPIAALNFYEAVLYRLADGTFHAGIWREDAGAITILSSVNLPTWTDGDSLGIKAVGSSLKLYMRNAVGLATELLEVTDATYGVAGKIRLAWSGAAIRLDDFRAVTL
jgi:hypothetical protein